MNDYVWFIQLMTAGLSGGQYKHVLGRPIFKGEQEDTISMAFLYSPPSFTSKSEMGKTISLGQQVIVAIVLSVLYHFLVYFFKEI